MSRYVFKSTQSRELIEYVSNQYGRDPEHLWARSPDFAVWRRGDNQKWFGGIFTVKKNKILPGTDETPIEILDIRCAPDMLDFIVDKKLIFPGWHMNKRHWITIPLDGRMKTDQIERLLDVSFELAGK